MDARDGFVPTTGNTPSTRLRRLSGSTGREMVGRADSLDLVASDQDRVPIAMVLDGESLRSTGLPVPPWPAGARPPLPCGVPVPPA